MLTKKYYNEINLMKGFALDVRVGAATHPLRECRIGGVCELLYVAVSIVLGIWIPYVVSKYVIRKYKVLRTLLIGVTISPQPFVRFKIKSFLCSRNYSFIRHAIAS